MLRIILIPIAASLSAAPAATVRQAPPEIDLRATATALATALSLSDSSAWRRLLTNRLSAAARKRSADGMRALAQLYRVGNGVSVVNTEPGGGGLLVRLRARAVPRTVTMFIAPERGSSDSLGIVDMLESHHSAADAVRWPTAAARSDAALFRAIQGQLDVLTRHGEFSGVVLITRRGTPVFTYTAGEADRAQHVRMRADASFHLASIGKMFTATAIAQLVAAGKLSFDDTLAKVLPAYPNQARAARITIRQLLSHTAGLGSLFDDPRYDRHRAYRSQLELASTVADGPLQFDPGTSYSYSNEGYEVLAAVVEQVSGERFTNYLQRHIWDPAGMRHTGNWGRQDSVMHRALGYMNSADDPLALGAAKPNWEFQSRGTGAGGNQSTAGDLARFADALTSSALVPASMRDSLWAPRTPRRDNGGYAFGAFVQELGRTRVVGHGGGGSGSGIDNDFEFAADGSWTLVVLGNREPPNGARIGRALVPVLARQWSGGR